MHRRRKRSTEGANVSRVANATSAPGSGGSYRRAMRDARRAFLIDLLRRHGGRVSAAAKDAGLGRPTMYTLMGKLGIDWRNLPKPRAVYLRDAPHCPTCACGLKPAALDRVNGSEAHEH